MLDRVLDKVKLQIYTEIKTCSLKENVELFVKV